MDPMNNAVSRYIDALNALAWMSHYATRRSLRAWTIYTAICGITRSLN